MAGKRGKTAAKSVARDKTPGTLQPEGHHEQIGSADAAVADPPDSAIFIEDSAPYGRSYSPGAEIDPALTLDPQMLAGEATSQYEIFQDLSTAPETTQGHTSYTAEQPDEPFENDVALFLANDLTAENLEMPVESEITGTSQKPPVTSRRKDAKKLKPLPKPKGKQSLPSDGLHNGATGDHAASNIIHDPVMSTNLSNFLSQAKQNNITRHAQSQAEEGDNLEDITENISDDDLSDTFDEQARNFAEASARFRHSKKLGKLSLEQEIAFRRLANEESRRRSNSKRHVEDDDEEMQTAEGGLFEPSEDNFIDGLFQRKRAYAESDANSDASSPSCPSKGHGTGSQGPAKKRSRKTKMAETAQSKTKTKSSRGKDKQRSKAQLKQAQQQANLLNSSSIGQSTVFRDAMANTARPEQPTFSARNKTDAMKELIASIPQDSRDTAKVDLKQLTAASARFTGKGSCRTTSGGEWKIKGMISDLTNYQMLGVSHMRERETTPNNPPAGGIHADAMGLGKTVMAIANIVNDRYALIKARAKDKRSKLQATLIIAPSSIIPQWKEECEKHAEDKILGKIVVYRPGMEQGVDTDFPHSCGVILTSYQQVMRSYPKKDPPVNLQTDQDKKAWWDDHFEQFKGFFHRVHWRRVVLDEATAIKNYQSQTAVACSELVADYRWALTGTPAMNALDEFYSYFRFLRTAHNSSYRMFRKNFLVADEKQPTTGKERLIAFMRPFMIRRTHNDTLFGAKLLNLPQPSRHTFKCHFTPLHAQLYEVVKQRFIEKINIMSRHGELRKQYTCILTLLLRLRQLTGHPLLIQDTMRDLLEPQDFERIREILDEAEDDEDSDQTLTIVHLRRMMTEKDRLPTIDTPPASFCRSADGDDSQTGASTAPGIDPSSPMPPPGHNVGGAFGKRDDFGGFMHELQESTKHDHSGEEQVCVRCGNDARPAAITSCKHVYCLPCTMHDTQEALAEGLPANKCKFCDESYSLSLAHEIENVAPKPPRNVKASPAASTSFLRSTSTPRADRSRVNINEIINTWLTQDEKMLPSAKTLAVKAQLMNWFEEDPNVKVIIYTQFNSMLAILDKICQLENWGSLKYNGSMSAANRALQIKKFEKNPNFNILIASLRCGGLGLNLTMATRVLLVDPWWNAAVEEQAFCRTYRRGQSSKTRLMRLAVEGTVDDHMISLQDKKIEEIDSVMSDENRHKPMPVANLLALFGNGVGHDDEGNAFIFTDGREYLRRYYPHEQDVDEDDV